MCVCDPFAYKFFFIAFIESFDYSVWGSSEDMFMGNNCFAL